MNGQYLCNRAISISYAFKKDSKGERHGSAAERLLAAQNPLSQADRPHQLFADAPPVAPNLPQPPMGGSGPSMGSMGGAPPPPPGAPMGMPPPPPPHMGGPPPPGGMPPPPMPPPPPGRDFLNKKTISNIQINMLIYHHHTIMIELQFVVHHRNSQYCTKPIILCLI